MDFSDTIINWYHHHKRELPWRNSRNPYIIWLSEIILQQTRVNQGLPYFYRFVETYPSVRELANAPENDVLRLWQGLGYYSRARNMLKTAQMIIEKHQGIFPTQYEQLLQLKGIGSYTAAAVSSFCGNEPHAVLDGNVFRVLSRFFGIDIPINSSTGKKIFSDTAYSLLNKEHAGLHNQAIMEFGALQCKPQNPNCEQCPLSSQCVALKNELVKKLPVKTKKISVKKRYIYYFVVTNNNRLLINQRTDKDIWANMYDFPSLETEQPCNPEELLTNNPFNSLFNPSIEVTHYSNVYRHQLTHQSLFISFIHFHSPSSEFSPLAKQWQWCTEEEFNLLPKPKIIFEYLRVIHNLL